MNRFVRTVDAADRLRLDLLAAAKTAGVPLDAACTPMPADFDRRFPFAWIRMLGGTRSTVVVDSATITIGVYAATWKQAMDAALDAHALIARLPLDKDALTDWKDIQSFGLPYEDPDPDHPGIPRCSFTFTAVLKAEIR